MTEEEVRDFFEKLRSQRQELYDLIQEREHVARHRRREGGAVR